MGPHHHYSHQAAWQNPNALLTHDDIRMCHLAFQKFDKDNSGAIDTAVKRVN